MTSEMSHSSPGGSQRWTIEQVESIAPSAAAMTAARPLASPAKWAGFGADDAVLWGSFHGTSSEPYEVVVDHTRLAYRCSCPSRKLPCKHTLGLLMLWVRDQVPAAVAPPRVEQWQQRLTSTRSRPDGERAAAEQQRSGSGTDTESPVEGDSIGNDQPDAGSADDPAERDRARDERVARMRAGLAELDRWLDDRVRTGLADPKLASYATWDDLAARLVDAQAGSLANRIRRLAGLVGASTGWHEDVLAELGLLHLLAQAGTRVGDLDSDLADAVATTVGWQVRQADVLAGVPETDRWLVTGRSDVREDRIEVRRHWLLGLDSQRWALVLSFAAYQQRLDTSLPVGSIVHADIHRYPGAALRCLVGSRHGAPANAGQTEPDSPFAARALSVAEACRHVGAAVARTPWLDRVPVIVRARVARGGNGWAITDSTGSLPLRAGLVSADLAALLAVSAGRDVEMTVEWTPHGVVPLAVHLEDRTLDIGPRANASFVAA